jgi:hypothetical protein
VDEEADESREREPELDAGEELPDESWAVGDGGSGP